ncbi:MAG TPA: TetR family transcriptional regulator [Baekduia sp.]|jgi:AcrR family transcriptional regulator
MTARDDLSQRVVLRPGAVPIPAWWPHRSRSALLEAMALNAAEVGFVNSRVEDVVVRAHASRRTFYAHFDNREQCLLAAHAAVADDAFMATADPDPQVALGRLMRYLAAWPAHAQLLVGDVVAVGPAGQARHEETMERLAVRLAAWAPDAARARGARGDELAHARFGALARLVQRAVLTGQYRTLPRLTPVLTELATREDPSA